MVAIIFPSSVAIQKWDSSEIETSIPVSVIVSGRKILIQLSPPSVVLKSPALVEINALLLSDASIVHPIPQSLGKPFVCLTHCASTEVEKEKKSCK